jgi:ketosteroid isomerase-like protein
MRMNISTWHLLVIVSALLCTSQTDMCRASEKPQAPVKHIRDRDAAIRQSLDQLNLVLATKNLEKIMTVYDASDDISVIGSDSAEVFIGRERVKQFMEMIISMPFVFSFEFDHPVISCEGNIAWVFTDGNMVHTRSNGKVTKVPYRVTAVMVKRGNDWKWKMFSGSIPRGE